MTSVAYRMLRRQDWESLNDGNYLTGNIIYYYCKKVVGRIRNVYNGEPYLWQRLEAGQEEQISHWLPTPLTGTLFFSNCVNKHWVLVVVYTASKQIVQYDTLTKNMRCARRIKKFIERTRKVSGFRTMARQPIVQNDGFNCGIHTIELIFQLAKGNDSPSKYLSRQKIRDSLVKWGYVSEFEKRANSKKKIITGGGPGRQKTIEQCFGQEKVSLNMKTGDVASSVESSLVTPR